MFKLKVNDLSFFSPLLFSPTSEYRFVHKKMLVLCLALMNSVFV